MGQLHAFGARCVNASQSGRRILEVASDALDGVASGFWSEDDLERALSDAGCAGPDGLYRWMDARLLSRAVGWLVECGFDPEKIDSGFIEFGLSEGCIRWVYCDVVSLAGLPDTAVARIMALTRHTAFIGMRESELLGEQYVGDGLLMDALPAVLPESASDREAKLEALWQEALESGECDVDPDGVPMLFGCGYKEQFIDQVEMLSDAMKAESAAVVGVSTSMDACMEREIAHLEACFAQLGAVLEREGAACRMQDVDEALFPHLGNVISARVSPDACIGRALEDASQGMGYGPASGLDAGKDSAAMLAAALATRYFLNRIRGLVDDE